MKIAVATSFYEAARPFIADWINGVREAARGYDVSVVAAVDDLIEPRKTFAALDPGLTVNFATVGYANVNRDNRIALTRATMLSAAEATDAEFIIFCDADDILTPLAINLHIVALKNADIAVGDLQPIDTNGKKIGAPIFGSALPQTVVKDTIADTNICGFSNTSVRRKALSLITGAPFPQVTAVDWWVFTTLLVAGCRSRRADGVVGLYRQHADNLLGSGPSSVLADSIRRLRIRAEHYRALGADTKADAAERLSSNPERLREIIRSTPSTTSGAWHADTASWCRSFLEQNRATKAIRL